MRVLRQLLTLLCAAAAAVAQGKQEKEVEALRTKARAEYEGQKATWQKFLLDAPSVADAELQAMTEAYDRCIDLCGQWTEAAPDGDAEADAIQIQLARRTARLRATIFGREMAKTRPVVVVSLDAMNRYAETVVVCPLTSQLHPTWRSRLAVRCVGKPAEIAVDQIRTLSVHRLLRKLDALSSADAEKLRQLIVEMYGTP